MENNEDYMQEVSSDKHQHCQPSCAYLQIIPQPVYKDTAGWHTVSPSHTEI